MASPPTGTVTFLFTDIEGSTKRIRRLAKNRYLPFFAFLRPIRCEKCSFPHHRCGIYEMASTHNLRKNVDGHSSRKVTASPTNPSVSSRVLHSK
jgi:hypothetical protein